MKESIFGEVKGIYNRLTFMEIIVAILWAIIGIIMISDPGMSNQIFSILTGSSLISFKITFISSLSILPLALAKLRAIKLNIAT